MHCSTTCALEEESWPTQHTVEEEEAVGGGAAVSARGAACDGRRGQRSLHARSSLRWMAWPPRGERPTRGEQPAAAGIGGLRSSMTESEHDAARPAPVRATLSQVPESLSCMRIRQGQKGHQNFGVYVKLTLLCVKIVRVVLLVHGDNFQCYFAGPNSFSGILRRSQPFDAIEPIFPWQNHLICYSNQKSTSYIQHFLR